MPIRVLPALQKEAFLSAQALSQLWTSLSIVFSHFPGKTNSLITLGAEPHEAAGFGVKSANVVVDDGLPDNSQGGFGAEEVFVVELVDHFHDVLDRQPRVLDV